MHYLKCNKCGFLNEVKTEYLVFCTSCGKKLDDNYSDWSKKNSNRTFDDFKVIMCKTGNFDLSKKPKKAKSVKYWIGFAVAFAIIFGLGQIGGGKIAGLFHESAFDKELVAMANEINKTCPFMLDNITRLDNTMGLPNNNFQYNYTLVGLTKESININELKSNIEPTIINFVSTNPDMKIMRDKNVTVNYYYKDNEGAYLFTISVKPEQYK